MAKYPIVSIEEQLAEDDWDGWTLMTKPSGGKSKSSATTSSSPPCPG